MALEAWNHLQPDVNSHISGLILCGGVACVEVVARCSLPHYRDFVNVGCIETFVNLNNNGLC